MTNKWSGNCNQRATHTGRRTRGGGGTPLFGLNGDVRPNRVWFSGVSVLNGVSISPLFVLNKVSVLNRICIYVNL